MYHHVYRQVIKIVNYLLRWIQLMLQVMFGISVYSLLYKVQTNEYVPVLVNGTTYELGDIISGNTYTLQVAGVNTAGAGVYSDAIELGIPITGTYLGYHSDIHLQLVFFFICSSTV